MTRSSLDHLRSRILASLGLTLIGCGAAEPSGADEADVTTDPSGGGSSSSSESGTSTGTSSSEESSGTDDSSVFDLPPPADLPPLGDCTVMVSDATALEGHPECPLLPDQGCGVGIYIGCVEPEPGQTCERLCPEGDCVTDWTNCHGDVLYELPSDVCGPYEIDGMCCSIAQVVAPCTEGRPFVIDEHARRAALAPIDHADFDPARFAKLPVGLRRRLADHWAAVATAEHASIASFARFAAQLLAIAAPPELIRDAFAAAADEVRHAEAALALASAFEGRALGFGSLDVRGALDQPLDLAALVGACVREGCIGETLAALELMVAADECEDAELATLLAAIAQDELRHAELAWRFVKWALDRQPELRTIIAEPFAALAMTEPEPEPITADDRRALRSLGCLPADERHRVELEGVHELLRPCANALLTAVVSPPARGSREPSARALRAC